MIALSLLSLLLVTLSNGVLAEQTVHIEPKALNYSGTWVAGTSSGCGDLYKTYTLGSTVSYTFTGVAWQIYLGSGGASASAQATDGINNFPVTNFTTPAQSCTTGFNASNLPYGEHTVTVTHESAAGLGTYVLGFDYTTLDAAEIASLSSVSSATATSQTAPAVTSGPTASNLISPANPTQPAQSNGSSSHAISTGAIIGIVIGIVIICIALLVFFYLKHRSKIQVQVQLDANRRQAEMTPYDNHPAAIVEYIPAPFTATAYTPSEAETTPMSETKSQGLGSEPGTPAPAPPPYQV